MNLEAYHELIRRKRVSFEARGLQSWGELPSSLFPHQRHGVEFALRQGCSAMFYDTGLGKSRMAHAWAQQIVEATNRPVLMLCPLAVGPQHAEEARQIGVDARVIRDGSQVQGAGVYIINYDRLDKIDPSIFSGVVLDECFAPDTPVDVVDSSGNVSVAHIENIQPGDKILNAAGIDVVADVHRREVPYAVRVRYAGRSIIASPNHPFLTREGWKGPLDLLPGDEIVATAEAMRMVRRDVRSEVRSSRKDAVLRSVLLSEMADETAGVFSEGSFARSCGKAWEIAQRVVSEWRSKSGIRERTYSRTKSDVQSRGAGKVLPPIEGNAARTFRAWGQRSWFDAAAESLAGCSMRQLDSGICFVTGATDTGLSYALQARLGEYRNEARNRGGWSLPSVSEAFGRKEGSKGCRLRVEGIEVLELGNPELDKYRDADGKLYFYDIGATRHPSFSIHGGLVHNSSIIKNFTGATTRALISSFGRTRYRMACTATPAPNDHTELGQHSAFLGVMDSPEMLSRWFLADQTEMGRYRLKKAAVRPFWEWVASWARCVSKPSDIGFSDEGFDLPELVTHRHEVRSDIFKDSGEEKDGQARLFRIPEMSATSIHKEKRFSLSARADVIASVIMSEPSEPWVIWVDTNEEADAMIERLRGPDTVEVRGSQSPDEKEAKLVAFSRGNVKRMITKSSIAGFGLNWQHCARQAFIGLSFSYESYYQAVRRCWRFGQKRPVHVHLACADTERAIYDTVTRKADDHSQMKNEMTAAMKRASRRSRVYEDYNPTIEGVLPSWMVSNG